MSDHPLGEMIGGIIASLLQPRPAKNDKAEARRAEERARREAEAQQREWRALVERQKIRGHAGDATPEEAREALRGRGGRRNPLDDRWF